MYAKRILLLSEGFGTGHTRAAEALAAGIQKLFPGTQTCVMELGNVLNPRMAPVLMTGYRKMVSSSPRLLGRLYRRQYHKSLQGLKGFALYRLFYRNAREVISRWKPDAIVCTHPFPASVVSRLKQNGMDIPLFTLITDYDAHGTWINQEIDQYLVPAHEVRQRLIARGVLPSKIEVTGIPVHPEFWTKQQQSEARTYFGFDALPTVLVMGGGWGISLQSNILNELAAQAGQIQLIICTGSNKRAYRRLQANALFRHPQIHIMRYTREVSGIMDASDLLITKPGGMTCTEGMAKKLPMLFIPAIPGQEDENSNYFVSKGYAHLLTSADKVVPFLQRLHSEPSTSGLKPLTGNRWAHVVEYNPETCSREVIRLLQASSVLSEYDFGAATLSSGSPVSYS